MTVTTEPWTSPPRASAARWLVQRVQPATFAMAVCTAICAWFVIVPLSALFYTAFAEDTPYGPGGFTLENFIEAYSSAYIYRLFWNSLVFAVGTAALSFVMGAAVAWTVERTNAPGRELFHSLSLLSFALPGLLTTMAWMLTLSPNIGWVNTLLKEATGGSFAINIYSMGGMIWALSSHYFPLAYLLIAPSMRMLDIRMEEAAATAGAGAAQVLFRVTLPLLRPAILSTLLLLFIRGIESFEVPRLIGNPARIEVFTTEIQRAIGGSSLEFGKAGALSLTLLVICIISVYFYRHATSNAEAFATVTGKGYKPVPIELGRWRWPVAIAVGLMFVVALGLPLLTLAWQSFFPRLVIPFMPAGTQPTLANYVFVLNHEVFLRSVRTSVLLGALAATVVVALTFVTAWIVHRGKSRWGWLLDALAFSPIAIPGVIVGASVLFAYLLLPLPVYNTIWILLIAYVTLYMPYGMRFAASGITQIHRELEEAAEVSGARASQMFLRVLLPLLAPVMVSAWLYVFVLAVRELGASVFLIGPHTPVLGTVSLTMWEQGSGYGYVCALGVMQVLPLLAIVAFLRAIERRVTSRFSRFDGGGAAAEEEEAGERPASSPVKPVPSTA